MSNVTPNKTQTLESAVLSHWRASLKSRHGSEMVANNLEAYSGDPDYDESDLAVSTRYFWRQATRARRGPVNEREEGYFELFGLTDEWQYPKLTVRAQRTFAAAPLPVDISLYSDTY